MIFDVSLTTVLTIIWSTVFVLALFALTQWALQQPDAQSELIRGLARQRRPSDDPNATRTNALGGDAAIEILVVDTAEIVRQMERSRAECVSLLPGDRSIEQQRSTYERRRSPKSLFA